MNRSESSPVEFSSGYVIGEDYLYGIMIYLVIIILSLLLSFFFSGTETAFVSVNKVRIEVWKRQNYRFVGLILRFMEHPERFLYTTLIGNNIANIAFASFATIYLNLYLKPHVTWLLIVIISVLLGEIIPKTLFRVLADWVVRKVSPLLEFFYWMFSPLIFTISKISEMLISLLGHRKDELHTFFSQKDIDLLLHKSQAMVKQNNIVEGEFLSAVLKLKKQKVREVMVPRTEIIAVPNTISIKELAEIFTKTGVTKIPVYEGSLDSIVGVVFLKELFLQPQNFQEIIREVLFVPETKLCSELLSEFKTNNISIAVVIDEYGGTAGLVTTEDLVEELFGEIEDEHDVPENWIVKDKTNPRVYRVNARVEIEKLNEELNIQLPEGDYETLAGFLLTRLGYIPRPGEVVEYNGITFEVTRATRRKVQWVKVTLP